MTWVFFRGFTEEIQSHDGFDGYATRFQTTKGFSFREFLASFWQCFVLFLFPCPLKIAGRAFTDPRCREALKHHNSPANIACPLPWSLVMRGASLLCALYHKYVRQTGKQLMLRIHNQQHILSLLQASPQTCPTKKDAAAFHLCPHRSKCKSSQSPDVLATVLLWLRTRPSGPWMLKEFLVREWLRGTISFKSMWTY